MKTKTKIINFTKKTYEDNRDNLRTAEKFTMNKLIPVWATLFVFTLIMIAWFEKTEANDPVYKTEICKTDKCKSRVLRLNECNWDIDCAVKMTLDASYDYLYIELANLEEKSSEVVKRYENKQITYDSIQSTFKIIPYKLFEWLERQCREQKVRDNFHCIKTWLSIANAESSWENMETPFWLQSSEKGYRKWVESYNKFWYKAQDWFFFYWDWGVYGKSHYCTDEESSWSKKWCPNGKNNFNKAWNSIYLK